MKFEKCSVKVINENNINIFEVQAGQTIKDFLDDNGIFFDAPCGGNGTCGKCKVAITGGLLKMTEDEKALLTDAEAEQGIRLACYTKITGDAVITLKKPDEMEIMTGSSSKLEFKPHFEAFKADLAAPTLAKPIDDKTNILRAANAAAITFGALERLSRITNKTRNGLYVIKNGGIIIDVSAEQIPAYGMAVDIGTTTVVAYFYDLLTGRLIDTQSGLNEQRAWGADVISRISACIDNEEGIHELKRAIIGEINGFIESFCKASGASSDNIYIATFAGNTTMLHIAAGINPANIANAPFIPVTLFGESYTAQQTGLALNSDAKVYFIDCVSSYIGGDITAGMLSSGLDETNETVIYIDIGTNGEMALKHGSKILCCSTAAGPAFEGAHIKFGTGGVSGAISSVTLKDGNIKTATIGDKPASGICGSGLIDAIAVMVKLGVVDETGRIADSDELDSDDFANRLIETDDGSAFIIDEASAIYITQKDIREVQLAKSAIASGIECLLHDTGIKIENVDKLVLAGGFGSHINGASACEIGLLPKALIDKIEVVGNAAGNGAAQLLLSEESFDRLDSITSSCEYIELSGHAYFQDRYIENMMF